MKESQISDALRESMNAVRLSPALRAKALCAMRGSEERRPKMKRKFSAALAFALVGILVVAVALAVANRKGVLDFLSYSEATLPENAGDYVQTDIASDERDGLHAAVREVVYDGHRLWATVDINMDGEKPLLTGLDYGLDDEWAWLRHDESRRTTDPFWTSIERKGIRTHAISRPLSMTKTTRRIHPAKFICRTTER